MEKLKKYIERDFLKTIEEVEDLYNLKTKVEGNEKDKKISDLVMAISCLDSKFKIYDSTTEEDTDITYKYMNLKRILVDDDELHEIRIEVDPEYRKKINIVKRKINPNETGYHH